MSTSAELTYAADFSGADVSGARFRDAILIWAVFRGTCVDHADFARAKIGSTVFAELDLSATIGLQSVEHWGFSTLGLDTIHQSRGILPIEFLRGVGVNDLVIDGLRSVIKAPPRFHSCFISYSARNDDFAQRIYSDLQASGVRCWFAPHNLAIGAPIRRSIYESIKDRDKLLLVLFC